MRSVFAVVFAFCAGALALDPAAASTPSHGLSSFGDLKYPADFKHFEYVNPNAPKGGRMWTVPVTAARTFNHFNAYILKGTAPEGLGLIVDALMTAAADEPGSVYGLIAKTAEVADDKMSVTFKLRPEAKFRDGTQVKAEDAAFTFKLLKEKGHPNIRSQLTDVVSAEAPDAETVIYRFKGEFVRDLPLTVATLPVLSKAYYTANDFEKETFDAPMGSGPYEIGQYRQGSFVTYNRRKDYWAANLPVNVGRWNFDEIRYEYYTDRTASLEAFKSGREHDLREEFTSKSWATEYDFPGTRSGKVKLLTLPDESPSGAQGFFFNTRREKFKDVRVRKALDLAFDFEWSNKTLFYGLYKRTESYFENSESKASGPPSPEELALLEPFRAKLPPEVFGEPYKAPVTDGSGNFRPNLRRANQLLDEAGWKIRDGVRYNAKGERLDVEFLIDDALWERIVGPYAENLRRIGVFPVLTRVDAAQEQERTKKYDFDVDVSRFSLSETPGPEIRNFWSSQAGKEEGSFNLPGIDDPVVDALIERILRANSRQELVTACRAIDRVLRAGHYWVPQWYKASFNIAFWDRYSRPAIKPKYSRGIVDTWWFDKEKAEKASS
jgi:microcin C transport system substrate-binding protein